MSELKDIEIKAQTVKTDNQSQNKESNIRAFLIMGAFVVLLAAFIIFEIYTRK